MLPRNPVPPELTERAVVPGMPEVRAWAGRVNPGMQRDFALSFRQESAADFPADANGIIRYPHLALSGGGSNGAFGAGFLRGWTATGTRPPFKIVTGISTGALMAPFAFVGAPYDRVLEDLYTTTSSDDIFLKRSILIGLLRRQSRDALGDTTPLAGLLVRYVDSELLGRIADAHRQGRRLYIGTVDLDSQEFVVWNMGLIALSGHPDAPGLFRKVMLASASIPILFPPVLFQVEADGRRYDEMHVDGAVGLRVFLNGGVFRAADVAERSARGIPRDEVFVIHNGQLNRPPNPTPRTLGGVTARVLEASGRAGMVGDLLRIYAFVTRQAGTIHWVTIPGDVETPSPEVFDPGQMRMLFDLGYQKALAGPAWETEPPGLRTGE